MIIDVYMYIARQHAQPAISAGSRFEAGFNSQNRVQQWGSVTDKNHVGQQARS